MGPVGFDLHPLMIGGIGVACLGIAIWTAAGLGWLPGGETGADAGWGLAIGGMALYFLGRVVQLWARYRGKP